MTKLWHPFADMGAVQDSEFVIERGEDVWVWDTEGRRYLDGTASLWYANVGHGRPEIRAAIAEQLNKLEAYSAFGDFANRPALELADALTERAPMPSKVFLGSGGGDAIDTAAKLAHRYFSEIGQPDRRILISRRDAYHGTHGFGTALAGIPANRQGFAPNPDAIQVDRDSLEDLEQAIERVGADRVAAIFVEPVIGAGGVYPPVDGYIEGVAALCDRHGILFVADSVICGFGRLGSWYGVERWNVRPSMIAFAKGVTSGYLPLGGVIVADEIAEPFWRAPGGPVFRHGPTYSAHATCCAAGLANIGILENEGLLTKGAENEGELLDAIRPLADSESVAEIRGGIGTLAAVELTAEVLERDKNAVARVALAAREAGVLVRPLGRGVATSPPLTATSEHFAMIGEAIEHGLAALHAVSARG
jgi:adenosylmethionine-8-amino-7-oxononanoate aminotransferase